MPISVRCDCGITFAVPDEHAGSTGTCPRCGRELLVPLAPAAARPGDPVFGRDKFLLHQKHFTFGKEKYVLFAEDGSPLLYVERPYHTGRDVLALLAALAAFAVVGGLFAVLAWAVPVEALKWTFGVLAVVGGLAAAIVVAIACSRKRHVWFYRDEAHQEQVMDIQQLEKVHISTATYTVRDAGGQPLAVLRKNYLYDLFRKRWDCHRPDGSPLCVVREDSLARALFRRYVGGALGTLLVRTNFVFLDPTTDERLGEFNRKFTILDRYVLDMSADVNHRIDRRVAVAIGVMLDTGERR